MVALPGALLLCIICIQNYAPLREDDETSRYSFLLWRYGEMLEKYPLAENKPAAFLFRDNSMMIVLCMPWSLAHPQIIQNIAHILVADRKASHRYASQLPLKCASFPLPSVSNGGGSKWITKRLACCQLLRPFFALGWVIVDFQTPKGFAGFPNYSWIDKSYLHCTICYKIFRNRKLSPAAFCRKSSDEGVRHMRSGCTNWYLWHWSLEPFGHNSSWIYVSFCPFLWLQSLNSKMVRFLFNFKRI